MTFGIATVNHRVGFSKLPFSRDITPRGQCSCGCESRPKLYDCDVGYSNLDQATKTSIFGPAFQNVGSGELSIQDIVPYRTGEDKYVGGGALTLQLIDEDGAGIDVYNYFEADELDEENHSKAGWYWSLGEYAAPDAYAFDFGEGMVLTVPDEWTDVQFKLAGQVDTSTTNFPVPAKTSILSNTRPAALAIQNITPSRLGEDKYVGGGALTLQLIDEDGAGVDVYNYFEADELDEENHSKAGWYWSLGEYTEPDAYDFKVGEGMVLTVPDEWADVIFTIPEL